MTEWVPLVSAPNAALVLTPASISENGGVSTVTATLSSVSSAAVTITVSASPVSSTGAVSGDYALSTATTLTIAAGSTTSTGTVTITANDNMAASGSKQVTVSATAAGGNGVPTPSSATLTITDDDPALQTTLLLSSSSIAENAGVATVTATLDRTSSAATTITVSAAAGAGAVAADFSLSSATTLTIAANATTSTGTVTITANDNDTDSPDKQVTVTATVANSQDAGSVTGATLTLTDDDAAPGVTLTLSPSSISENGGASTVTATLTHPSSEPTTVTVTAVSGFYTVGSDATIAIAAGSTAAASDTATIAAVNNAKDEPDRTATVTATLANSQGAGTVSGATLTLEDDDAAPGVTLTVASSSIPEGGSTTVSATLSHPSSAATTVTVTPVADAYSVAPGSGATIVVAAGSTTSADTATITAVDNDVDAAEDKTVTVTGTAANSQGAGTVTGATLTIADNDDAAPGVTLTVASSSIPEGGSTTVSATLSHPSSAATTVTVTPVADAYSVAPGSGATIVVAAGSTTSADTATITAVDNDVDAAEDKTVTVTGTAANSQGAGTVTGASLTIADDDEKGLAFARAEDPDFDRSRVLEVTAGGTAGSYTAALTSKPTGTVTVSVTSDNADVTVNPASLTFDATDWSTAQPVTVTAAQDGDDYADAATLAHDASGGGYDGVARALPVAVAETGDTRVLAVPVTAVTERVYRIGAETVRVTYSPLAGNAVPSPEGSGFGLGEGDARVVVGVSAVSGLPTGGLTLCLAAPQGIRDAAAGRELVLLRHDRHDGTAWTAVSDSAWDATEMRVCASKVREFATFALGYANTEPKFDTTQKDLMFTVDEEIDPPVMLPAAKGGDGTLRYALTPALPRGVKRSGRRLSGTPTEESKPVTYTWTATDADNETVSLTFTIEVEHGLEKARERLKAINESVLPELSRALWGSALDAVTGRLESPDAAAPTAAGGLEAAAGFVRANESALEEGDVSWKELLGAESFAFGLAGDGEGGAGIGGAVAWGSGDWQTRSRYEDALDWSGGAFSAHAGVDAALRPDLRAGLAASWFSSDVDYTDRNGDAAVTGSHESRMMSLTPYLGWDVGDGTRLWGAAGYGWGKIEIVDADLRERFGAQKAAQKADSRFLAGAAGGSVPVWSRGPATLEAKGSAEATRWRVKDNGDAIAGVVVSTRRLRLAAVGSRAYALDGGATLTPSLELGGRWDGGDGATGAGLEGGAGLSWTDPARGLTVEAKGRALLAHNSNVEEEWGASGSMRLETDADGLGLSFGLRPSWGASGSGLARLWHEGVAARPAVGGGNEARLETELGYGLPAFGGAGVTTPYAGFGLAQGGERDLRAGVRLGLDAGFDLGLEAERRESAADTGHGIGLDLSIRW